MQFSYRFNANIKTKMSTDSVHYLLSQASYQCYPARGIILSPQDRCDALYLIINGAVKVVYQAEGNEMVIRYLNAGDFFGEVGLFYEGDYKIAIRTKEKTKVAKIPYALFEDMSRQHPDLVLALTRQMALSLRKIIYKVGNMAFTPMTQRVIHVLHELCNEPGAITRADGVQIKANHREIARIVGCCRESVGHTLRVLKSQGLVSFTDKVKTMVVHDPKFKPIRLSMTQQVIRVLRELCNQPGAMTHPDGMQVKINRCEIARIIGCCRESVCHTLRVLKSQGLVSFKRKGTVMVVHEPIYQPVKSGYPA